MLPIEEELQEEDTDNVSDRSESTGKTAQDRAQYPSGEDIQTAIEKGDWAAVGATAAILASSGSSVEDGDFATRDSPGSSSRLLGDSDVQAAELDQLVDNGDWDVSIFIAFYVLFIVRLSKFCRRTNARLLV